MTKPQLQLALDNTRYTEALAAVTVLNDHVDIIEAGTILCLSEGVNVVRLLREQCPNKLIVADFKVADAGEVLAKIAFNAGANWMTVMCSAPLATMEKALDIAQHYPQGDIQIELFGHWHLADAKNWRTLGIKQAIFHRGRDAQASGQNWGQDDLDKMKALSDLGLELSITGGIEPEDLPLFRNIATRAFIAGRALVNAPEPAAKARQFRQKIDALWS